MDKSLHDLIISIFNGTTSHAFNQSLCEQYNACGVSEGPKSMKWYPYDTNATVCYDPSAQHYVF